MRKKIRSYLAEKIFRKKCVVALMGLSFVLSPFSGYGISTVEAAASNTINNPSNEADTWDTVYFGSYLQEDTNGDGVVNESDAKQPIQWRVLSRVGDEAVLISNKILDAKPYNAEFEIVSWEDCSLRKWLNGDFYNTAFSAAEQSAVIKTTLETKSDATWDSGAENLKTEENVYILSFDELINDAYGFEINDKDSRIAYGTTYAKQNKLWVNNARGSSEWWMRRSIKSDYTSNVDSAGNPSIDVMWKVTGTSTGVRPVIHVNLSSPFVTKGETIGDQVPKDEWIDSIRYESNGVRNNARILSWKSNSTGWWIEDTAGYDFANSWQKIDGVWYYFKPDGYMASNEYYGGCWLNSDGSWDSQYSLSWKSNSEGWWVEDVTGWWPSNYWLKIDGFWYYFDSEGYMVTSQYVDGWWIDSDGVCR